MGETKTVKIPIRVHKELKVFTAKNDKVSMTEFVGQAILKELNVQGHKFVYPKQKIHTLNLTSGKIIINP